MSLNTCEKKMSEQHSKSVEQHPKVGEPSLKNDKLLLKGGEPNLKGGSLSLSQMKSSPFPEGRTSTSIQKFPIASLTSGDTRIINHRLDLIEPRVSVGATSKSPKTCQRNPAVVSGLIISEKKITNLISTAQPRLEKCPMKPTAEQRTSITNTDSEESEDDSGGTGDQSNKMQTMVIGTQHRIASDDWQILEGLRNGQHCSDAPNKFSGYIMKSRKWPMKGWHKRFFLLENGILTYAKSPNDLEKGKYHGTMDTGLSVVTYKKKGRRIDVDADDLIYHLKTKTTKQFEEWVEKLSHHRLYRQHEISFGTKVAPKLVNVTTPLNEYSPMLSPLSPVSPVAGGFARGDSFERQSLERMQSRVTGWLIDTHGMEAWNKELTLTQSKIFELGSVLDRLRNSSQVVASSWTNIAELQEFGTTASSKKDKTNKKYFINKTSAKKDRKAKGRLATPNGMLSVHTSSSNPNLSINTDSPLISSMVQSMGDHDRFHEQFYIQAKEVHDSLKGMCHMITTERERLKRALEYESSPAASQSSTNFVQLLRQELAEAMKQNTEYRNRLSRIHAESSIPDRPLVSPVFLPSTPTEKVHSNLVNSVSLDSQVEFYDAPEQLDSSFTDESEDEEEEEEETSDNDKHAMFISESHFGRFQSRRRSKLPVPKVECDISLWSLLCKNIGKDLSKISMPVSLNEPLNALQRICEELEYSELLDRTADIDDPYERMVLIATFAVSGYASTYSRAGQKPFNPLLGETYECIREDKGWKFIAEQVSHHPPVAASFCESKNFVVWQDMQVKTKFWGKSMEVLPVGLVHLTLTRHNEHYTWNKATSCVHNILGGQRWIDHYGEVMIVNQTLDIKCKLTFVKSSYWSAKKHEVFGIVQDTNGVTVHHVFGRWNEGIYSGSCESAKCIWRPGALPPDSDLYYGYTRFAIELNELDKEQILLYPPTDTRFRPDQRLLEEGKLIEADKEKQRLEQMQREERKKREEEQQDSSYSPRWFMKKEEDDRETYVYNGKYWELRKDQGFGTLQFPKLW